jgi:hypothetical protein
MKEKKNFHLFFFLLWYWGFNSGPLPGAIPPALFCGEFYETGFGCWWFMPVILATQEAEIRRITIQSQSGQIV